VKGGQRFGAGRRPSEDPRDHPIQDRLTKEEHDRVVETAAHYKWTVSKLVLVALGLKQPEEP
jgi:hypothetical protein